MRKRAEQLYQTMLREMLHCRAKDLLLCSELECCFQVANKYQGLLKKEMYAHVFDSTDCEIDFYKNIKPKFNAETEYYGLRYHAHLFREGTDDPDTLKKFWTRESLRLSKFIDDNRKFYDYYTSGATCNDKTWFVCAGRKDMTSSQDHLIATLLALEKYNRYVQEQLAPLNR